MFYDRTFWRSSEHGELSKPEFSSPVLPCLTFLSDSLPLSSCHDWQRESEEHCLSVLSVLHSWSCLRLDSGHYMLTTYANAKKFAWLACSVRLLGIQGNTETERPFGFSIHAPIFFSASSLAISLFFWFRNHIISKVRHISHSRTYVFHSIGTNRMNLHRFSFALLQACPDPLNFRFTSQHAWTFKNLQILDLVNSSNASCLSVFPNCFVRPRGSVSEGKRCQNQWSRKYSLFPAITDAMQSYQDWTGFLSRFNLSTDYLIDLAWKILKICSDVWGWEWFYSLPYQQRSKVNHFDSWNQ
jgi:hypothetical protein